MRFPSVTLFWPPAHDLVPERVHVRARLLTMFTYRADRGGHALRTSGRLCASVDTPVTTLASSSSSNRRKSMMRKSRSPAMVRWESDKRSYEEREQFWRRV